MISRLFLENYSHIPFLSPFPFHPYLLVHNAQMAARCIDIIAPRFTELDRAMAAKIPPFSMYKILVSESAVLNNAQRFEATAAFIASRSSDLAEYDSALWALVDFTREEMGTITADSMAKVICNDARRIAPRDTVRRFLVERFANIASEVVIAELARDFAVDEIIAILSSDALFAPSEDAVVAVVDGLARLDSKFAIVSMWKCCRFSYVTPETVAKIFHAPQDHIPGVVLYDVAFGAALYAGPNQVRVHAFVCGERRERDARVRIYLHRLLPIRSFSVILTHSRHVIHTGAKTRSGRCG